MPDPGLLLLERTLAGDEPDLHAQELVEREALRGTAVIFMGVGTMDAPVRVRAVDEVVLVPERGFEWIGEPAPLGLLEAGAHELAELPREHLGLTGLWIHGHDGAGVLTHSVEHVDDGVGHLSATAPVLDAAEERGLGADGQLLLAPRLIEEHDTQVRRAVEHLPLDDGPALSCASAADLLHLREDRGLLAHCE